MAADYHATARLIFPMISTRLSFTRYRLRPGIAGTPNDCTVITSALRHVRYQNNIAIHEVSDLEG
jgi:hypothetical protein